MSRKHILDAIEASLRRLGTDYIDLYQLHSYDPHTPIDEALEALDTVVRSGKARYVGVSNWPAYKVARALGRSELRNLVRIDSVQPRYNLLFRSFERDLLAAVRRGGDRGHPLQSAGRRLADRQARSQGGSRPKARASSSAPPGHATVSATGTTQEFATVEALRKVAAEAGCSLATLAMRWVLSNPAITAPIIGASRPEQLADSIAASEQGALPGDLKAKLDEITLQWRAVDAER